MGFTIINLVILRLEVELTSRTNASRGEWNKTFIRAGLINYCNLYKKHASKLNSVRRLVETKH